MTLLSSFANTLKQIHFNSLVSAACNRSRRPIEGVNRVKAGLAFVSTFYISHSNPSIASFFRISEPLHDSCSLLSFGCVLAEWYTTS